MPEASGWLDPANDPDLPRYVLPAPWTPEFVTDIGLWSAEERAQRQALQEGYGPPGGFDELVWTQGFQWYDAAGEQTDPLPIVIPDVVVTVHRQPSDEPPAIEPDGEPISVAGFTGHLITIDDPIAPDRSILNVVDGRWRIEIIGVGLDPDDVRRFAAGLTLVGEDPSGGFRYSGDAARLLLELPGVEGASPNLAQRWVAGYTAEDDAPAAPGELDDPDVAGLPNGVDTPDDWGPSAWLMVQALNVDQFRLLLTQPPFWGDLYEPVAGGAYLANQYEFEPPAYGEDGLPVTDAGPTNPVTHTSLLRFDPERNVLVALNVTGDVRAAIELMEGLTEVDIDTWRTLAEPYNAKPLKPR
jgi:hypothetical protein